MSLMRRRDDIAARALAAHGLPRVKTREVKHVNDGEVCESAALAYGRVIRNDSPGRRVHVLHMGGRFVVLDPDEPATVTFDSSFAKPIAVVSD